MPDQAVPMLSGIVRNGVVRARMDLRRRGSSPARTLSTTALTRALPGAHNTSALPRHVLANVIRERHSGKDNKQADEKSALVEVSEIICRCQDSTSSSMFSGSFARTVAFLRRSIFGSGFASIRFSARSMNSPSFRGLFAELSSIGNYKGQRNRSGGPAPEHEQRVEYIAVARQKPREQFTCHHSAQRQEFNLRERSRYESGGVRFMVSVRQGITCLSVVSERDSRSCNCRHAPRCVRGEEVTEVGSVGRRREQGKGKQQYAFHFSRILIIASANS